MLSVIKSYLLTVTHAEVCFADVSSLHCYQWSDHTYRHLHMLKCVLLIMSAAYSVISNQIVPLLTVTHGELTVCFADSSVLCYHSVIRSCLVTVTHAETCFAGVSRVLCYLWSNHTYQQWHMLKCLLLVSAVYSVISDQIVPTKSCWCQQCTLLSVIKLYLPKAAGVSSLLCCQWSDRTYRQWHMFKYVFLASAADLSVVRSNLLTPTQGSDECWSMFCWHRKLTLMSVVKS